MPRWSATVSFDTARPFTEDEVDDLLNALVAYGAAIGVSRSLTSAAVSLTVDSLTPLSAVDTATTIVTTTASPIVGELVVTGVESLSEAALDAELLTPTFPEVVGYAEIAEMAGVSRQRARQFAGIAGFPVPVIETTQGPLMTKAAVASWLAARAPRNPRTA
ncbi:hypothetical protein HQQ80_06950 [Microbacteriaceae bacterium VKM Ac-2855]|nr:hypothetical protein [Microbacteriaceae bacterium VKM Ac-2855]